MLGIGFSPMNGGINNQKLALLGLIRACLKERRPLVLPEIVNFVAGVHSPDVREFETVFRKEVFLQFLDSIGLTTATNGELRDSWPFFVAGTRYIAGLEAKDLEILRVMKGFIGATYPDHLGAIISRIPVQTFDAVIQLRVENDWLRYVRDKLKARLPSSEDILVDPLAILAKFKSTFEAAEIVYVCMDQNNVSFDIEQMTSDASSQLGLRIKSKFDFIKDPNALSSNLDMSLVDAQIAADSKVFVGTTRSTFSNFACLSANARGLQHRRDYIYNAPSATVVERCDLGTSADPHVATQSDLLSWLKSSNV